MNAKDKEMMKPKPMDAPHKGTMSNGSGGSASSGKGHIGNGSSTDACKGSMGMGGHNKKGGY